MLVNDLRSDREIVKLVQFPKTLRYSNLEHESKTNARAERRVYRIDEQPDVNCNVFDSRSLQQKKGLMTLKELKEEAAKILQLASNPPQGFEFEMFTTGSGGVPANKVGIKYASQREWVVYSTASNGDAMASETIILCADTGAKDKEGRTIWITPESVVFVWDKWAGSPEDFDRGNFISPSFN